MAERERPSDPVREIRRDIGIKLTVLARLFRNDFDRRVAVTSLTRSKFAMVAVVARRPGVSQRMIAETLEMSEVSAGRLIERLCNEGLLERRPKPGDRRAFEIYLTDAAQPVLDEMSRVALKAEEVYFRDMSIEEMQALLTGLDKLYNNITSIPANCTPPRT